ncbi:MAG: hypothetical protein AB7O37_12305 [Vicinamibacteria bacterium]
MGHPSRARAIGGLLLLALFALAGLGGAASARPLALGGVSPGPALVALAAVVGLLLVSRGTSAAAAGLGLLILIPAQLGAPGLLALTGPPVAALCLGVAAFVVALSGWRPPGWALPVVVSLLAATSAARVQSQVGAEGDEPHYLMVAESLQRDGDLDLTDDYVPSRYASFYRKPMLEPHFRVRGRSGRIYSLHAVGLSLLVLPAWALGGYPLVSFFMAGLLVLLVCELRGLLREAGAGEGAAEAVAWICGLSPPLLSFAGLVFSEIPAALALTLGLRLAIGSGPVPRGRLLAGLGALAALPWLNVRYLAFAVLLALGMLAARRSLGFVATVAAALAVSGVGLALFHFVLYGFFDPRRVYGARPEFAAATLLEGLPGLLLDQEFGLLVYAPVFALALVGFVPLARDRPRLGLLTAAIVASALLVAGSWHMWRGGFNPPARFLVPVVPALALALAAAFARSGPRAAAALLAGWGVAIGLLGVAQPRLLHRDRDGGAPVLRAASGAEEWTRLLPGYVLGDPDRHRLAALWAALLASAAAASTLRRPPRTAPAARVACSLVALGAACAVASSAGQRRSEGRDAVRLLGRSALHLPALRLEPAFTARWGPAALDWGPLYEPHRHADGAMLGARLPLAPGRYRLEVAVLRVAAAAEPPRVLVVVPGAAPRVLTMVETTDGFATELAVGAETPADVTLALWGGSPLILREVRLASLNL